MINIIEFCCFVNNTGYAHAAIDYAKSLRSYGADVYINCAHGNMILDSFNKEDREWLNNYQVKGSDVKNIDFQFRQIIPPRWKNLSKRRKISALAVFESTRPPNDWINAYKSIDNVICPSEYCADVFWAAGLNVRPKVIPHAIDINYWKFKNKIKNNIFTILSIGTWRKRKNWHNIIEGVIGASSIDFPIKLIIKTDKDHDASKYIESIKQRKNVEFEVVADELSDDCIRDLIYQSDCLLSASVGEGFCISPIQAMACGTPVICSAVGGCLEYTTDENCIRIDPRGYETMTVMDNIPQFRNQEWAIITSEDVSEAICKIISLNNNIINNMTLSAREYVVNNFSYQVVGKKMLESIFGT
jgi:glycosyltransferase involved in cell wall biosynthesis